MIRTQLAIPTLLTACQGTDAFVFVSVFVFYPSSIVFLRGRGTTTPYGTPPRIRENNAKNITLPECIAVCLCCSMIAPEQGGPSQLKQSTN